MRKFERGTQEVALMKGKRKRNTRIWREKLKREGYRNVNSTIKVKSTHSCKIKRKMDFIGTC